MLARVPGDRGNLRFRAARVREQGDSRAADVVKGHVLDAGQPLELLETPAEVSGVPRRARGAT